MSARADRLRGGGWVAPDVRPYRRCYGPGSLGAVCCVCGTRVPRALNAAGIYEHPTCL